MTKDSSQRNGRAATLTALAIVSAFIVFSWVDLSPRVEPDFFFSSRDPQLLATERISERFPSPPQIIVRAGSPDVQAEQYRAAIRNLTDALGDIDGVIGVNSVATDDVRSPLWQRLLLTPDGDATNLILQTDTTNPRRLVPRLESVIAEFENPSRPIVVSGVPYVIELIRRNLLRDLVVFSFAAFVVFATLVGLVYRRWQIVGGMLVACVMACSASLIVSHVLDISIGLLTANIAVIVFVLTLSHTVFLAQNWRQTITDDPGVTDPARAAVRLTRWSSFWCMLTTFLGFSSLQLASAKPLRELGIAGAIGTLTAFAVAYGVFPSFLRAIPSRSFASVPRWGSSFAAQLPRQNARRWLVGCALIVVLAGLGVPRVNTDPSLLSYFASGTPIRNGLEVIDRDGGSSPLSVVVSDASGDRLDTDAANRKMWALQERLESDPAVGVTLSPVVLLAHARRAPLAGLLNWNQLLDVLESPLFNRIALSFVTNDRQQGLFFLRMRESARVDPREAVVARIEGYARDSGLDVVLVGGQFELQAQLGRLIRSSLRLGLGGLLTLFAIIAFVVSRSKRVTLAMVLCLAGVPLIVLGVMGHADAAIDIISSPAASVALAMGVDSMIHLVVRVRKLLVDGADPWTAWLGARDQLWQPIVSATFIICAGFGIFSLSTFPPTQRFGVAVILGTLVAAAMCLVALPFGAAARLTREHTVARAIRQ